MKKIVIAIVVLLVILIAIFSMKGNKNKEVKAPIPAEEIATTTVKAPTPIMVEGIKLVDGSYNVNPSDVKLVWTGKKKILKTWIDSGSIDLKEAVFEVKDGAIVSNKFVIDMTSIAALSTGMGKGKGNDQLSTHLKSADFFDATAFPTSSFVLKSFASTTDAKTKKQTNMFLVKGDLTIKGKTNEITIPVSFNYSDANTIVVKGSADIDRTVWDIRYGSDSFFDNLGNNVIENIFNLSFELKLKTNNTTTSTTATSTKK